MSDDPKYNWIYKKLVTDHNDVLGALAYVLYKEQKIRYIEKFVADEGHQPDDNDFEEFHRITNLDDSLVGYQERADVLLEKFLDNTLAEQLRELSKQMHDDAVVRAVQSGFWQGVGQNVVAGLVTMLMTFGLILAAWMYSVGPDKILSGAAKKYLSTDADKPEQTPLNKILLDQVEPKQKDIVRP